MCIISSWCSIAHFYVDFHLLNFCGIVASEYHKILQNEGKPKGKYLLYDMSDLQKCKIKYCCCIAGWLLKVQYGK